MSVDDDAAQPSEPDVLAPWGPAGPPPAGDWAPDVLGDGFQAQTLELSADHEGPVVATLVRYLPGLDPLWTPFAHSMTDPGITGASAATLTHLWELKRNHDAHAGVEMPPRQPSETEKSQNEAQDCSGNPERLTYNSAENIGTAPTLKSGQNCSMTTDQSSSAPQQHFVLLYLHGRNDYFFQTELARHVAAWGGAFYALDLRKYGRSLRQGQTIGYVDDLTVYDEDIAAALDILRREHRRLPLVLMGHSTGGLIATVWAYRHPGALAGLILNSAWLEMQTMAPLRATVQPVLGRIALHNPMLVIPTGSALVDDPYSRSLIDGWQESGFPLPERLIGLEKDPAVTGWDVIPEWKRPQSYPVVVQWLDAIMRAQALVESQVALECPVLSMCSTSSALGQEWTPRAFSSDVVLDVKVIVERSATLAPQVTIARFEGKHDLLLSDPDVRAHVYRTMGQWVGAFI